MSLLGRDEKEAEEIFARSREVELELDARGRAGAGDRGTPSHRLRDVS